MLAVSLSFHSCSPARCIISETWAGVKKVLLVSASARGPGRVTFCCGGVHSIWKIKTQTASKTEAG